MNVNILNLIKSEERALISLHSFMIDLFVLFDCFLGLVCLYFPLAESNATLKAHRFFVKKLGKKPQVNSNHCWLFKPSAFVKVSTALAGGYFNSSSLIRTPS